MGEYSETAAKMGRPGVKVEDRIKFAKERKKKRLTIEAYKGNKARNLFAGGFGEGKKTTCSICGEEVANVRIYYRGNKKTAICKMCQLGNNKL